MKPEVNAGEDRYQERRDAEQEIESRYEYPKGDTGHRSVLGYIDAEHDAVVEQFWLWRSQNAGGPMGQAITQWEVYKFGARLYQAAHGVLVFHVFATLTPEQRPARYGRIQPGLSNRQRKERLDDALDAITRDKAVPDPQARRVVL